MKRFSFLPFAGSRKYLWRYLINSPSAAAFYQGNVHFTKILTFFSRLQWSSQSSPAMELKSVQLEFFFFSMSKSALGRCNRGVGQEPTKELTMDPITRQRRPLLITHQPRPALAFQLALRPLALRPPALRPPAHRPPAPIRAVAAHY